MELTQLERALQILKFRRSGRRGVGWGVGVLRGEHLGEVDSRWGRVWKGGVGRGIWVGWILGGMDSVSGFWVGWMLGEVESGWGGCWVGWMLGGVHSGWGGI